MTTVEILCLIIAILIFIIVVLTGIAIVLKNKVSKLQKELKWNNSI